MQVSLRMLSRRRTLALLAILVVGLTAALLAGGVGPASASGTFQLRDYQTGRCLDSNYNGAVYNNSCNSGNYQRWYFAAGYATTIQDEQTGLCLTNTYAGNPGGLATGACIGAPNQVWYVNQGQYGWQIKNYSTGQCLDSNYSGPPGAAYSLGCNGGPYQIWVPS